MSLRDAWEDNARAWVAWTRRPELDSFRFHCDLFMAIVPEPGRLTVDIGCGEGRLARHLKAAGHEVVGIDASPTMLEFARAEDPDMELHLADAADLPLEDGVADLAIAFMSFQDVDDMPRAVQEAARILRTGGTLCLAIVHPLNSAVEFESLQGDAPAVIAKSYLDDFRYADVVGDDALSMTFHSAHRPLEAYSRALEDAGFVITRIREPKMPEGAIRSDADRRWQRIPMFLHLRAEHRGR